MHELAKNVAIEAINTILVDGKTINQWMEEIKAMRWISVTDRLPEEGQSVIVHYVDGWTPVAHLLNGKWYQSGGETSWLSVTHWMPLPEPPKEDEKDA